jgi:hypothetical protein
VTGLFPVVVTMSLWKAPAFIGSLFMRFLKTLSLVALEKFLQSSGFRLSTFISDIFGASGRNIIHHLTQHGYIDRESLDACLKTKTRNHIDEILVAVNGTLSKYQQDFLKMLIMIL